MTTETDANKPTMAVLSARVALTARPLMATVGNNPTLTIGFGLGYSVMNSAFLCYRGGVSCGGDEAPQC